MAKTYTEEQLNTFDKATLIQLADATVTASGNR